MKTIFIFLTLLIGIDASAFSMDDLRKSERKTTLNEFKKVHAKRLYIKTKEKKKSRYRHNKHSSHNTFLKRQNSYHTTDVGSNMGSIFQTKSKMKIDTNIQQIVKPDNKPSQMGKP